MLNLEPADFSNKLNERFVKKHGRAQGHSFFPHCAFVLYRFSRYMMHAQTPFIGIFVLTLLALIGLIGLIVSWLFDKNFPSNCLEPGTPCYYSLLLPVVIPVTATFLFLNWMGLKLFRQN